MRHREGRFSEPRAATALCGLCRNKISNARPVASRGHVKRRLQLAEQPRVMVPVRALADQAFSRAAGAPLIEGNSVRLLIDAAENYPAWLAAIAAARHHVHFESYIIHEDSAGQMFADALIAKA